jgi:hypothetical protein
MAPSSTTDATRAHAVEAVNDATCNDKGTEEQDRPLTLAEKLVGSISESLTEVDSVTLSEAVIEPPTTCTHGSEAAKAVQLNMEPQTSSGNFKSCHEDDSAVIINSAVNDKRTEAGAVTSIVGASYAGEDFHGLPIGVSPIFSCYSCAR